MEIKDELKGLLKEMAQDAVKSHTDEFKAELAAQKEANEKLVKDNKEFREKMEALQGKQFNLNQNTGSNLYTFKGYNPNIKSNFKAVVDKDVRDSVAKYMLDTLRGKATYTEANTGAYAVPVEYTSALLGLAELTSVGLAKCRVITVGTNSIKMPAKGTRATVDAQAFGTANADAATTLAQITFTIDKRVGSYQTINNDLLADQMFDVVGDWIEPVIAEAIGQNVDDEVFNGTEYTTSVADVSASVTTSGTVATAAAVTFPNLVIMANEVELERGVKPEWFMPRGAYAAAQKLTDTYGLPVFNRVPIAMGAGYELLGYPVNIVSALDDTPANGAIRMAFGDPSQYIIALNGGMTFQSNPYILMKEGQTQFIGYMRSDGNYVASGAWTNMKRTDA